MSIAERPALSIHENQPEGLIEGSRGFMSLRRYPRFPSVSSHLSLIGLAKEDPHPGGVPGSGTMSPRRGGCNRMHPKLIVEVGEWEVGQESQNVAGEKVPATRRRLLYFLSPSGKAFCARVPVSGSSAFAFIAPHRPLTAG